MSSGVEDEQAGRVAHVRLKVLAGDQLARHTVIDRQPALGYTDGRGTAADLQLLPRLLGERDQEVTGETWQASDVAGDLVDRDERDPEPWARIGDGRRQRNAGVGSHPAQVPHRTVQHRERRDPFRVLDRLGEEDRILVRIEVEIGAQFRVVGERDGA
jgi:hypothetical protein